MNEQNKEARAIAQADDDEYEEEVERELQAFEIANGMRESEAIIDAGKGIMCSNSLSKGKGKDQCKGIDEKGKGKDNGKGKCAEGDKGKGAKGDKGAEADKGKGTDGKGITLTPKGYVVTGILNDQ